MKHHWSGWPGAYCLHCHLDDPLEQAFADEVYDPETDTWFDEVRKAEATALEKCPGYLMPDHCGQCKAIVDAVNDRRKAQ